MKDLITLLLILSTVTAIAQTSTSITKNITDDDKVLTLTYKFISNDRSINYENSLNVQGLTKAQKDALVDHLIDSLNTTSSKPPIEAMKDKIININDNGSVMTITVDTKSKERKNVHSSKTFDVKGKSRKEKDAIIEKVLLSSGLKNDYE